MKLIQSRFQLVRRGAPTCLPLFMMCVCQALQCQTPEEAAKVKEIAENLAKIQINFGPKLNSPGASISLKEVSRSPDKTGTAVVYRVLASGMPSDKTYQIVSTTIVLKITPELAGVTFDSSGQAVCAGQPDTCGDPSKPNDPIDLTIYAAKGEPRRFTVVSEGGQWKAFTSVIPFPNVATDNGCSIEAILLLPNAEAVLFHGSGFVPGAAIQTELNSEGEKHEGDSKADSSGNYYATLLPYVQGKNNGVARVTMRASACAPSAQIEWGKNTYHVQ